MTTKNDEIELLFRRHYASSLRLALAIVHDQETARDLVHDVFASFLSADRADITKGYLYRAVRNSCLNHIRDMSVRDRLHSMYLLDTDGDAATADDWPDEVTLALISDTLDSIPSEQCRAVTSMRYRLGMKYGEIAEALGISQVAVYKHLRHALDILRQTLKNDG